MGTVAFGKGRREPWEGDSEEGLAGGGHIPLHPSSRKTSGLLGATEILQHGDRHSTRSHQGSGEGLGCPPVGNGEPCTPLSWGVHDWRRSASPTFCLHPAS